MSEKRKKSAILLLTHIKNKSIDAEFSKISTESSNRFDAFLLCDNTERSFDRYSDNKKFFLFDVKRLIDLGYPGKSAVENIRGPYQNDRHHRRFHFDPANVDLPVLLFFRQFPDYDYYWTIEYDVRFTGSWDTFFSSFDTSEADLLGTTLTRYEQIPKWHHWPSLDLRGKPIGRDHYIRGFFPIYRLSRRALRQLDRDYRDGVTGHFECLIPTLLSHAGMAIEDIGGDSEFVRPGNRNRFYRNTPQRGSLTPGTVVFRPIMDRPGNEPNFLWHPVKASPFWRTGLRRLKRMLRPTAAASAVPAATNPISADRAN